MIIHISNSLILLHIHAPRQNMSRKIKPSVHKCYIKITIVVVNSNYLCKHISCVLSLDFYIYSLPNFKLSCSQLSMASHDIIVKSRWSRQRDSFLSSGCYRDASRMRNHIRQARTEEVEQRDKGDEDEGERKQEGEIAVFGQN